MVRFPELSNDCWQISCKTVSKLFHVLKTVYFQEGEEHVLKPSELSKGQHRGHRHHHRHHHRKHNNAYSSGSTLVLALLKQGEL